MTDNCVDTLATCTNTPGGFTCSCISGYSGDGVTCVGKIQLYRFQYNVSLCSISIELECVNGMCKYCKGNIFQYQVEFEVIRSPRLLLRYNVLLEAITWMPLGKINATCPQATHCTFDVHAQYSMHYCIDTRNITRLTLHSCLWHLCNTSPSDE